jgi:uncharacterized membrane protein
MIGAGVNRKRQPVQTEKNCHFARVFNLHPLINGKGVFTPAFASCNHFAAYGLQERFSSLARRFACAALRVRPGRSCVDFRGIHDNTCDSVRMENFHPALIAFHPSSNET